MDGSDRGCSRSNCWIKHSDDSLPPSRTAILSRGAYSDLSRYRQRWWGTGACAALPLLLLLAFGAACRHGGGEAAYVVPQLDAVQPRRVAFAPGDGERLLVLEATGLVGIWDVTDLGHPERLAWIPAGAIDACFTADGKDVVTAGWDGRLRRWTGGGRLVWTSAVGHDGPVRARGGRSRRNRVRRRGRHAALLVARRGGEPRAAHRAQGFVVSVAVSPGWRSRLRRRGRGRSACGGPIRLLPAATASAFSIRTRL